MIISLIKKPDNKYGRKIYLLFISLLLVLFIIRSLDFPVNIDELLHYSHAQKVISWYQSGGDDKACLNTPWTNLKYYGQSVDNLTALINKWIKPANEFTVRHITGAVFGWLLLLFASLAAKEITGKYRTAIYTVLLLLLIPPLMGQYCNNLKDIPFAAGYAYAILFLIKCFKSLPKIPWRYVFHLSLAIAFLISVRVGGLIIIPYLFLFLLLWFLFRREYNIFSRENRKELYRLLLQLLVIVVAGYFGGLLFWPYGLIDPISHPLESLSLMEHYSISIRQLFQGNWYWSSSLPANYLFVWLIISLPEIILAALILYVVTLFSKEQRFSFFEFIIVFSLVFPLFYVVIIHSNLYSGWRQMYFLSVPLSILAALGIERLYNICKRRMRILIPVFSVLALTAILPLIHYIQRPDTAYVYFNMLSGANKKAWSNYEYDYYWHGMKQAAEWFDENIHNDGTMKTIASNFDISVYLKHRSDIKVKYVHYDHRSKELWDFGIFGLNYIHPYQLKNNTWQPDNTRKLIEDIDIPLAIITKRLTNNDYRGVSMAENGKYQEAIILLEEAIQSDKNNFILFEYLADSYYNLGQIEECIYTIKIGKDLHPWSEKLIMLEAQLLFDSGDYNLSLEKCLEIVNINSKYYNIVPLLIACYKKTGAESEALRLKRKYNIR